MARGGRGANLRRVRRARMIEEEMERKIRMTVATMAGAMPDGELAVELKVAETILDVLREEAARRGIRESRH